MRIRRYGHTWKLALGVALLLMVAGAVATWAASENALPNEGTSAPGEARPKPEGRVLSKEEMSFFFKTYIEKFTKTWQERDQQGFRDLYTKDAQVYRTMIRGGEEVRRTGYRGAEAIIKAVQSRPNLTSGTVEVIASEVEGFSEPGTVYLIFTQDFTSRSTSGAVTYSDRVTKTIRLVQTEDGDWKVDFEDSKPYRPDRGAREEVTEAFFKRFDKGELAEEVEKLDVEQEFEPTPTPIPTPEPTATPIIGGYRFRIIHEVSLAPLPGTRSDVVTLDGKTEHLLATDAEGYVNIPGTAGLPAGQLHRNLFFNRNGFEERRTYYNTIDQAKEFEEVRLALIKPLVIPQEHTVMAGESLASLAEFYYGDAGFWPEVLAVNNATLATESGDLPVGLKLLLPPQSDLLTMRRNGYTFFYAGGSTSNTQQVEKLLFAVPGRFLQQGDAVEALPAGSPPVSAPAPANARWYRVTHSPRP